MVTWYLEQTSAKGISAVFERVRNALEKEGETINRPLNSNVIVLDYDDLDEEELERRATQLVCHLPGRIFYLLRSQTIAAPTQKLMNDCFVAGGSVPERQLSRTVLNEIIFGGIDILPAPALLNLIQGHLHVGFSPILLIFGKPEGCRFARELIKQVKLVSFSSEDIEPTTPLGRELFEAERDLVDTEWLKISEWREQLRNLSLRHALDDFIGELQLVKLQGGALRTLVDNPFEVDEVPKEGIAQGMLLLAGWIIRQLRSQVVSFSSRGIECHRSEGIPWFLNFEREADSQAGPGSLYGVEMQFRQKEGYSHPQKITIILTEEGRFDTSLSSEEGTFHFSGDARGGDSLDDLIRYFRVGESTELYRESFREAADLRHLVMSGGGV